jgi:cadmium resistance protein CadD (predicted permease)
MSIPMEWAVGLMVGLPIVYILIDILLATDKEKGNTYSEILRKQGKKYIPLIIFISFGFGLLCGHWWW